MPDMITDDSVKVTSNEVLGKLVAQARPMPTEFSDAVKWGELRNEIAEVRETMAAYREGHDVSNPRLRRAQYHAAH